MRRLLELHRAALLLLSACLVLLIAGFGFIRHRAACLPNVVVVVADTLRADRLGAYGDHHGWTPFLDQLAARGVVFTNAYAASSWTSPSVASLFTSRYPSQHQVGDFDAKLADGEVTLAECLDAWRYLAAGFSANLRLTKALGYAQGFAAWHAPPTRDKLTSERLARKSLLWLNRLLWKSRLSLDALWHLWAPRPLFLYYQLMEPHAPYQPDLALRRRHGVAGEREPRAAALNAKLTELRWGELTPGDVSVLEGLYDEEVGLLDGRLRQLFAALERLGILEHAIIVFTADHGEEFRDHGMLMHGTSLFNELIRVPLILVRPGERGGRVVEQNVSLLDVAPTLLDLVGLPPEAHFEGRSLVPLLAGDGAQADVVAELPATPVGLRRHSFAFVRGSVKLLVPRTPDGDGRPVLYDLASDPYEARPDPPELAARARLYEDAARVRLAALRGRAGSAERGLVDEATRARLRALGYAN